MTSWRQERLRHAVQASPSGGLDRVFADFALQGGLNGAPQIESS
jgi:hypothetical protein